MTRMDNWRSHFVLMKTAEYRRVEVILPEDGKHSITELSIQLRSSRVSEYKLGIEKISIPDSDDTQVNHTEYRKVTGDLKEAKPDEGERDVENDIPVEVASDLEVKLEKEERNVENDIPVEVTNDLEEAKHEGKEGGPGNDSPYALYIEHQEAIRSCIIVLCLIVLLSKGGTAEFIKCPENVAVLQNSNVTFECTTTIESVSWVAEDTQKSHHSIFDGKYLNPRYSKLYEITHVHAGQFDLTVKQTVKETAMKFICAEGVNQIQSAEIIVIESDPKCYEQNSNNSPDLINITIACVVYYWGNWAPVMKWTSSNEHNVCTDCSKLETIPNSMVKLTRNVSREEFDQNFTCTAEFSRDNYRGKATATNVPDYRHLCTVQIKRKTPVPPGPDIKMIIGIIIGTIAFIIIVPAVAFAVKKCLPKPSKPADEMCQPNGTSGKRLMASHDELGLE